LTGRPGNQKDQAVNSSAGSIDVLQKIVALRVADVRAARKKTPAARLRRRIGMRTPHSLQARLIADDSRPHIIAEVKKASPSAGLLCADYRPADIAAAYAAAGAVGISVLTETRHFLGCGRDLEAVRTAVTLPILCKDFVVDSYQILEAALWGADVILLIAAVLTPRRLRNLHACSRELGLETLVEVHTARELEAALALEGALIGVNNRNLKTLKTSLNTARDLAPSIPPERIAIVESGIQTRRQIDELLRLGYRGFLIGESLMRAKEPSAALTALMGG
jgi:indole-3-glycerol phosphate synthase